MKKLTFTKKPKHNLTLTKKKPPTMTPEQFKKRKNIA